MTKASTIAVYCSGSIAKGADDQKKLCWTDVERFAVHEGAAPARVRFLNPDDPIVDAQNTLGQFGRDMFQVQNASVVVVDARERRGLGIGVEMAAAAAMGIPVVVVAPVGSKYRQRSVSYRGVTVNDYVHPHVAGLSAEVVRRLLFRRSAAPRAFRPQGPVGRHASVVGSRDSGVQAHDAAPRCSDA